MTLFRRIFLYGTLSLLPVLGFLFWIDSAPPRPVPGLIEIPPGATAGRVARDLAKAGRIRSALWFRFLVRLQGADQHIKAGLYRSPPGRRTSGLLKDLVIGRGETLRLTVPEGWALWQIADRAAALGFGAREDFLQAAQGQEGFLFPDTYYFEPGTTAASVTRALRERFDTEWARLLKDTNRTGDAQGRVPVRGRLWTPRDVVTLASLVEREARRDEERPRIAAVYLNRLGLRMRLECDPTVQYALGYWKNPLLKKDLLMDHPYNTYRRFGLPPGPICSPGREALRAVLEPADTRELYFVADETGGHWFSETYEDHLRAVRNRRRLIKGRKKS